MDYSEIILAGRAKGMKHKCNSIEAAYYLYNALWKHRYLH